MNIIVEGMDATGKSTLVEKLSQDLQLPTQISGGPPPSKVEMVERVNKYLKLDDHVFDRHPCISQYIYSVPRKFSEKRLPLGEQTDAFYYSRPIIIYCDPPPGRTVPHVIKEGDTPEHLMMIDQHKDTLLRLYRNWALVRAHIIYRIGDDMDQVFNMVWGEIACRKIS